MSDLRELPHFSTAEIGEIPAGWHRLLARFAYGLDAICEEEGTEIWIERIWVEEHRLQAQGRTNSTDEAVIATINRLCDNVETLSRSTCEACGKMEGSKLRRVGNSDRFAILCPSCAKQ